MHESSVTEWIQQLRAGDSVAAQRLWERYFQQMVTLARRRLEGAAKAMADEEDVALSAFRSFCLGARDGRFPQLLDSDSLWPLLMVITANKSVDLIRRNNRLRRGGRANVQRDNTDSTVSILNEIMSKEPTPEFAAEVADQLQRLLNKLREKGDDDLSRIALLRMDGFSHKEIADRIGCSVRSIDRKMIVIAQVWEKDEDL
jgi:RNA polymerase sigma factor (sigma-70 family)